MDDLTRALDAIPGSSNPAPSRESARATGTHGPIGSIEGAGRRNHPPQKGPHTAHDSARAGAIDCESGSDDRAGAHRHKPLSLADLGEGLVRLGVRMREGEGMPRGGLEPPTSGL